MAKIVNLRDARKARERAARRAEGDANAAKFGRTKAERELEEARAAKARAFLDGHARGLSVRPAAPGDLPSLLTIIHATLRETNAKDYPAEIIDRLVADFTPTRLESLVTRARVLVVEAGDALAGVGALDGAAIRSLFVAPDHQKRGAGTALMTALLALPEANTQDVLRLSASLGAVDFYRRFGFQPVGEAEHQGERTILMERRRP